MGKINIAEILKNCPKGMELDCAMWDGVTFEKVQSGNYPIRIRIKDAEDVVADLTEFGEWNYTKASKCVIFPKGKTTWEGFVPPCKFKDGDIIYTLLESNFEYISIFQKASKTRIYSYVDLGSQLYTKHPDGLCLIDNITSQRLATKEEKQKLFQAIKDNGYRWNTKTKTLEKLIEPNFKVGDLQPYKETMKTIESFEISESYCANEVKIEFNPSKYEMVERENGYYVVKKQPQYPKTYEECCKVLDIDVSRTIGYPGDCPFYREITCYENNLLSSLAALRKLIICRDAYWKIAEEEMGLGKSWEPDWTKDIEKYVIYPYQYLYSIDKENYRNTILAFPTKEMRDAFYENFKELINECKSLL